MEKTAKIRIFAVGTIIAVVAFVILSIMNSVDINKQAIVAQEVAQREAAEQTEEGSTKEDIKETEEGSAEETAVPGSLAMDITLILLRLYLLGSVFVLSWQLFDHTTKERVVELIKEQLADEANRESGESVHRRVLNEILYQSPFNAAHINVNVIEFIFSVISPKHIDFGDKFFKAIRAVNLSTIMIIFKLSQKSIHHEKKLLLDSTWGPENETAAIIIAKKIRDSWGKQPKKEIGVLNWLIKNDADMSIKDTSKEKKTAFDYLPDEYQYLLTNGGKLVPGGVKTGPFTPDDKIENAIVKTVKKLQGKERGQVILMKTEELFNLIAKSVDEPITNKGRKLIEIADRIGDLITMPKAKILELGADEEDFMILERVLAEYEIEFVTEEALMEVAEQVARNTKYAIGCNNRDSMLAMTTLYILEKLGIKKTTGTDELITACGTIGVLIALDMKTVSCSLYGLSDQSIRILVAFLGFYGLAFVEVVEEKSTEEPAEETSSELNQEQVLAMSTDEFLVQAGVITTTDESPFDCPVKRLLKRTEAQVLEIKGINDDSLAKMVMFLARFDLAFAKEEAE